MNDHHLTRLLSAFADQRISPADMAELEARLLSSPEARQQFWSEMSLHGLTREAAGLKWAGKPAPERQLSFLEQLTRLIRLRKNWLWATAAALLLVAAGFGFWPTGKSDSSPDASQLVDAAPPVDISPPADASQTVPPNLAASLAPPSTVSATAVFKPPTAVELIELRDDVRVFRSGHEITAIEHFAIQSGDEIRLGMWAHAVIGFADGSRFRLFRKSVLRLQGATAHDLELVAGRLQAQVAKPFAGPPFVLRTTLATVTVKGTLLDLAAARGVTRVEVGQGLVQVDHSRAGSSVELAGGEFALALPEGDLATGFQSPPSGWVADNRPLRDVGLHPFKSSSPWNCPLAPGAIFAAVESSGFDFAGHGAALVPAHRDRPIILTQPGDPEISVAKRYGPEEMIRLRLPLAALPESARPVNATVVDTFTGQALELIQAVREGDGLTVLQYCTNDLRGDGIPPAQIGQSGSGLPLIAGVIREGELATGIRHALAATVWHAGLSRRGPDGLPYQWPARHSPMEAKGIARMADSGNVHFGTLLAIPPDVNLVQLGVGTSGPAFEVAQALQKYGTYVTHSYGPAPKPDDGIQPHIQFFAEGLADAELSSLTPLISRLASSLKVVTSNAAPLPGSGPLPPP